MKFIGFILGGEILQSYMGVKNHEIRIRIKQAGFNGMQDIGCFGCCVKMIFQGQTVSFSGEVKQNKSSRLGETSKI